MRLTKITVNNFKSLVDFKLPLDRFNCLIGLNGAGKTTVLQAVDFLCELFWGDISDWLEQRQWEAADLNSRLIRKSNIQFTVYWTSKKRRYYWRGNFNRSQLRCTSEVMKEFKNNSHLMRLEGGELYLDGDTKGQSVDFEYQGSIISKYKNSALPEVLVEFKQFMRQITSLELLAPHLLRRRARSGGGGVGIGGERLSAFIHELSQQQRTNLENLLQRCYPQLQSIETHALRAGWKQLKVKERYDNHRLSSEARHVNDGMLRLIAILAETLGDAGFLLFDEIENGINPELIEFLLDHLVNAKQQILVTTNSPMILNYLNDEVARRGVQYLYRTPEGYTRAVPFFEIPSLAAKLKVMGPGEAFVDTELSELPEEITRWQAEIEESDDAAAG